MTAACHPRFRKKSCYSTAPEIIATVAYRPSIINRSSSCSHGQSSCPPAQSVDMWGTMSRGALKGPPVWVDRRLGQEVVLGNGRRGLNPTRPPDPASGQPIPAPPSGPPYSKAHISTDWSGVQNSQWTKIIKGRGGYLCKISHNK